MIKWLIRLGCNVRTSAKQATTRDLVPIVARLMCPKFTQHTLQCAKNHGCALTMPRQWNDGRIGDGAVPTICVCDCIGFGMGLGMIALENKNNKGQ